jgi:hypothetical protein
LNRIRLNHAAPPPDVGELARRAETYAGTGTLRVSW